MPDVRTDRETEIQQRRGLLHGSLVALEAALSAPITEGQRWCLGMRMALDRLAFTLADHVEETEAPGGLLDEIDHASPWLHARVERLRRDHVDLVARTGEILDRCHAPFRPDEVREDVLDLLGRLVRHRHEGADLLYDAYELDLSAGD
jgi:hypothetical protein